VSNPSRTLLGFYSIESDSVEYLIIVLENKDESLLYVTQLEPCFESLFDEELVVLNSTTSISYTGTDIFTDYDYEHNQLIVYSTLEMPYSIYDVDPPYINFFTVVEANQIPRQVVSKLTTTVFGPCSLSMDDSYMTRTGTSFFCQPCGCEEYGIDYNPRLETECLDDWSGNGTTFQECECDVCTGLTTIDCYPLNGSFHCECLTPYGGTLCDEYDASVEYHHTPQELTFTTFSRLGATGLFVEGEGEDFPVSVSTDVVFMLFVLSPNGSTFNTSRLDAISFCSLEETELIGGSMYEQYGISPQFISCSSSSFSGILFDLNSNGMNDVYTFAGFNIEGLEAKRGVTLPTNIYTFPSFFEIDNIVVDGTTEVHFLTPVEFDGPRNIFLFVIIDSNFAVENGPVLVSLNNHTVSFNARRYAVAAYAQDSWENTVTITSAAYDNFTCTMIFGIYPTDTFYPNATTTPITTTPTSTTTTTEPPIIVFTDTSLEVQSRDLNATVLAQVEFRSLDNQSWPNKWLLSETFTYYDDRPVPTNIFQTLIPLGIIQDEAAMALTYFYLGGSTVKFNMVSPTDLVFENNEVVWKMYTSFSAPILSHKAIVEEYMGVTIHKFLMTESSVLVIIVQNTVEIDGELRNTTHTTEIVNDTLTTFSFIFPAFLRTLHFEPSRTSRTTKIGTDLGLDLSSCVLIQKWTEKD